MGPRDPDPRSPATDPEGGTNPGGRKPRPAAPDAERRVEGGASRSVEVGPDGSIGRLGAGLAFAFRFLTVLPAPSVERSRGLPRAATAFPMVGVAVGAPVGLILALPLPPLPRAALALLVWVVVTGGLHEDGWMDVLDGAFAPVTRGERLEILKDPRVGAHGATGGALLLLLRFSVLTAVTPAAAPVAAVIGRWAMALSLAAFPPARGHGLGADFAAHPQAMGASLTGLAVLSLLAAWTGWTRVGLALALAGCAGFLWGRFLSRRFGGLTGDGHGSVGHLAEVSALLAFLPLAEVAP